MMSEIILLLKRTVFLPKGSPGICTVREIKADIRHYEVAAEGGRVFCSGEADLLIEYLSFAAGKQYPGYESYEQQLSDGGSMWQALMTLPFELTGNGEPPCPPLAELNVGELDWFMVSPHALEMEITMCLSWQEETDENAATPRQPDGWQQITLAEVEKEGMAKMKMKEERLNMGHDDKIMRMGVTDQGWQIATKEQEQEPAPLSTVKTTAGEAPETSILEAAILEVAATEAAALEETAIIKETAIIEEFTVIEETTITEESYATEVITAEAIAPETVTETVCETVTETITETVLSEVKSEVAAPLLNIQTVETPWQLPADPQAAQDTGIPAPVGVERPSMRRRPAGLPRLHVRREQIQQTSTYQVNFHMDDK